MRLAYLAPPDADPYVLRALRDAGHVVEATDRHGLHDQARFDVLLLDGSDLSPEAVRAAAALAGGAFVVVLGAPKDERARAGLLRAGADACFPQPVSLRELLARLEAWERSSAQRGAEPRAQGRLKLAPAERSAVVDGRTVALTAKEFLVLETLARRPGEVLSAHDIVRLAWGDEVEVDPTLVSTYVARLRAKLERPFGLEVITAVRGHGYRFEAT